MKNKEVKTVIIQHEIDSDTLDKIDKLAEMNTTRTDLINEYIRKGLAIFATVLVLASCSKQEFETEYINSGKMDPISAAVYECETVIHQKIPAYDWQHVGGYSETLYGRGDNPPQDSVWYVTVHKRLIKRYTRTCKITK